MYSFINFLKKCDFFATLVKVLIIPAFITIFTSSCYAPKDPITGKTKRMEPNLNKRAEEFVKKEGSIIFGGGNKNQSSGNFEFATSNPLWRASLNVLDFIPIQSANYSGGILVTDWYSKKNNNDSIKIEVRFLSNELASTSIKVISYKRTCIQLNCQITKSSDELNNQIKIKILDEARKIRLIAEREKK
jgi:hypothetical protein